MRALCEEFAEIEWAWVLQPAGIQLYPVIEILETEVFEWGCDGENK